MKYKKTVTERALEMAVKTFWESYKPAYDCPATTCSHMAGVCGTDKYCVPAITAHFLAAAKAEMIKDCKKLELKADPRERWTKISKHKTPKE